ncbi:MAG TPA: prepilin-type N-terminal cleavage/methylation domain-containing protein [Bryobacteraceae bacterium]|jgi:prepilin-type N-terminal cleavage/methylation domain-containing protein|nr:prepilin-type N-terminal cleavage/methylation domain-containing protein [Bryobacteraceae bacterium]
MRRPFKRNQRGFTLLEALVATMIMGIAVAGILDALAASTRNVTRLTQADRAVILARTKMDELLVNDGLIRKVDLGGPFTPAEAGAMNAGWRARVTPIEIAPEATELNWVVDRIELEIWWMDGTTRHSFSLEGYRRALLPPGQGI